MLHYYGDVVRRLFLVGAFIMALSLPFFWEDISLPLYITIFAVIVVDIAAGVTTPAKFWSSVLNLLVSILAVISFEYYAVRSYTNIREEAYFFLTNQVLAIIFLLALYYSVKTVRGTWILTGGRFDGEPKR
jgi:hypothetical protein